jgi:hypothetical protein
VPIAQTPPAKASGKYKENLAVKIVNSVALFGVRDVAGRSYF